MMVFSVLMNGVSPFFLKNSLTVSIVTTFDIAEIVLSTEDGCVWGYVCTGRARFRAGAGACELGP